MIVTAVVTVVRRNIWPVLIGLVASSLLVGLYAAPFLFVDDQCSSPDTGGVADRLPKLPAGVLKKLRCSP